MNAPFQLAAWVMSSVLSHAPLETPIGKPVKAGTLVATPAVPVNGVAVQQCMCAAVVFVVMPLKLPATRNVCATEFTVTVPEPVAVEAFGGDSLAPVSEPE
jgi:hypothetical protein